MAESRDHLGDALHDLRGEIRDLVTVPAAAGVRARAVHQLRVRRTATAVLAAAAVAAVALGGTTLLRPTAGPPVPPAGSPTPPSPVPSLMTPDPVTPSPRPEPLPVEPLDDPIVNVDWVNATITVPPREGCPDGTLQLSSGRADGGGAVFEIYPDGEFLPHWAYGDVTGDDRNEAIMEAQCYPSGGDGQPSGHGGQLLVVARAHDGTLTGLGWVGPRGANIMSVWVSDRRVLMTGDPWTAPEDEFFPLVPGLVLSYRWEGDRFVGWEPAPEYPPLLGLEDVSAPGAPVVPRAVADGLGCPDAELRFAETQLETPDGPQARTSATAGGATYLIPPGYSQQYLFDLDNTGHRLLVTALHCTRADGSTTAGLAVLERAGDGWQGISVLAPPRAGQEPWSWQPMGDRMLVEWGVPDGDAAASVAYRWTGTVLEPIDD